MHRGNISHIYSQRLGKFNMCVGDEDVNYLYLVDAYYDGSDTTAVVWDDIDLDD